MKQRYIRRTLLAVALSAFGASTFAQVPETEPNHPITSANILTLSGGTASVTGSVGKLSTGTDVDFFAVNVTVPNDETIKVDITPTGSEVLVYLLGPGPAFPIRAWSFSPGIDTFPLDVSGQWVVGIVGEGQFMQNGGGVTRAPFDSATYALTVTVKSKAPAEQHISLDIKPGSAAVAPLNPKAKGKVPVALLSSDTFDATQVDEASLTFGALGNEGSFSHCDKSRRDVNGDGKPDLVCHFDIEVAGFSRGDSLGKMKGKTKNGQAFVGTGDLKVTPEKREKR